MKLWKVTLEVELVIASENEPHGMKLDRIACEEAKDNGFDNPYGATEIVKWSEIPEKWRGTTPRGDDRQRTCEQIVEAAIEARKQAAWNAPLPNQTVLPLEATP